MKFRFLLFFTILFSLFLISCGSTPKKDIVEETLEPEVTEDYDDYDELEDIEDDVILQDEDEVETVDEVIILDDDEAEYIRSTNALAPEEIVTREEFSDDKAKILEIIEELQVIMEKGDVNAWLKYIDPASVKYYSSPVNIRKAQKKLPNKTIMLNGIGDYFKFVFIPARKRSEVKEIRYISKTNIKAVDVKDDGAIVVYYQFVKIDNKWFVHIPTL